MSGVGKTKRAELRGCHCVGHVDDQDEVRRTGHCLVRDTPAKAAYVAQQPAMSASVAFGSLPRVG